MRVLIIEKNQQVIKDITFCLQVRYPDVVIIAVDGGQKGIDVVESESLDLVMLDCALADMEYLNVITSIREFSDVPLITLCEAETDFERAKGLEAGADEYVTKPFSPIELLARVNALLRRIQGTGFKPEHLVTVGAELTINFTNREVSISGRRLSLTPTEYRLLAELVRSEGKVLTHHTLLDRVWGSEYDRDHDFIKTYIYRLRSKIEPDASNPRMLVTERGVGYKFVRPI
jgi:two-component system KDP operon response regulator KdpE